MNKANLIKKTVILALVLIVPGFLYYLLTAHGKNHYTPLAYFGPRMVAKTFHKKRGKEIPDTLYHTIADFNLTDQNGKKVSLTTLKDKIVIANFFYTHCPTVCNLVNDNVNKLLPEYTSNKNICFVSITVDPQNDSVSVLKQYEKQYGTHANRLFLTGDTATIYNLARKGFLVNAVQTGKNEFNYSDQIILIDPNKHIRGYYRGASTAEVTTLNDEIKVLITEVLLNKDAPLY
jgi:protein SCO1/2